jgi:hypothetical protein
MFTQLIPPIPVHIVDRCDGYAIGVLTDSLGENLIWITALTPSGEILSVPNANIRLQKKWPLARLAAITYTAPAA